MKRIVLHLINVALFSGLILIGSRAFAQEFRYPVEHDHLIKSCKGELIINNEGVEYKTDNKDHARKWTYTDIKMIKLDSPKKVEVLTYESRRLTLGRDENFEFKVLSGEVAKEVSDFLLARVSRPLATSFVQTEDKAKYEFSVRHQHRLSSCQGTLKIYEDKVIYQSGKAENSSYWRLSDIQSFSRTGPYQFSITTYEPKFGGPTKIYNFDLKEPMNDEVYDYLWAKIYKVKLPTSIKDDPLTGRSQP